MTTLRSLMAWLAKFECLNLIVFCVPSCFITSFVFLPILCIFLYGRKQLSFQKILVTTSSGGASKKAFSIPYCFRENIKSFGRYFKPCYLVGSKYLIVLLLQTVQTSDNKRRQIKREYTKKRKQKKQDGGNDCSKK